MTQQEILLVTRPLLLSTT